MKIIDRYMLRAILAPFSFCLFSFFFLWIIYDLFDTLPDIIKSNSDAILVIRFYLVQLPLISQLILPISFFFAVLYVLVHMSSTNELAAVQSGGMGLHRVSIPFFLLASVVMGIQFWFFFNLTPEATSEKERIEQQISGKGGEDIVYRSVIYKNPVSGNMWYIQELNATKGELRQAEVLMPDDLGRDREKLFIAQGTYRKEGYWDLAGIRKVDFARDGSTSPPQDIAQMDATFLTESPDQLTATLRRPADIPWGELHRFINAPYRPSPNRMAPYYTEYAYRTAYPFFCPVLCLFAFAFGISHDRRSKVGSIFNSLLVLFAFLVWFNLSLALGNGKRLPPFLAAWNTILIFGGAGLAAFAHRIGWLWDIQRYLKGQRIT